MKTNYFIAKTLWSKGGGKEGVAGGSSIIAIISVAISILVMTLAITISDGFKREIREKSSAFNGEIQLHAPGVDIATSIYPVEKAPALLEEIAQLDGVEGLYPYAYRSAILKKGEMIQGVLLKGVEANYNWRGISESIVEGRLPQQRDGEEEREMILSRRLASMLSLELGESLVCYFVDNSVKARKFTLVGLFDLELQELDKTLLFTSLDVIQGVNGWSDQEVSGIEVRVKKMGAISKIASSIEEVIDKAPDNYNYFVSRIDQLYPHLFDWLTLLDFNVLVITLLMIAVAGFNMISGLLILLFEKTSMIGLLKALGMRDGSIHQLFLIRALTLTVKGMVWGNLVGYLLLFLQSKFKLFALNPANYFVDHVPVDLNWAKLLLLNIGSIVIITLLLMIPSLFITRVAPDKTLRVK